VYYPYYRVVFEAAVRGLRGCCESWELGHHCFASHPFDVKKEETNNNCFNDNLSEITQEKNFVRAV